MGELAGIRPENIIEQRRGIAKRFLNISIRLACLALLMAGCTTPASGKSDQVALDLKTAIPTQLSEVIQNTGLKLVPGAGQAMVAIFAGYPESSEYEFSGQGFIVDNNGRLSIYSINHVAVGEEGYANIPGSGLVGKLTPYWFFYDRGAPMAFIKDRLGKSSIDRVISATLDETSSTTLFAAVKEKGALPLTIAKKPVEDLEEVAMPSLQTGRVTILRKKLTNFFSRSRYEYEVIEGPPICDGDSGSPFVRKGTTEVVATLSSGGPDDEQGCTTQVRGLPLAR